jgi:hypothetical protein
MFPHPKFPIPPLKTPPVPSSTLTASPSRRRTSRNPASPLRGRGLASRLHLRPPQSPLVGQSECGSSTHGMPHGYPRPAPQCRTPASLHLGSDAGLPAQAPKRRPRTSSPPRLQCPASSTRRAWRGSSTHGSPTAPHAAPWCQPLVCPHPRYTLPTLAPCER